MFIIFQAYTLNDLLLETQMIVDLGLYLLLCALLSQIVYVTLLSACLVLPVENSIIHMARTMISQICGVCDVTMTSDFSDHI